MHPRKSGSKSPNEDGQRTKSSGFDTLDLSYINNPSARKQSPSRVVQLGSGDKADLWEDKMVPTEFGNYHTVSGVNAIYLKDALSKNIYLQTVDEDEKSSLKSRKHGFFVKKDPPKHLSTSPHCPPAKHTGKVKHFFGSIRNKNKSSSMDADDMDHHGNHMSSDAACRCGPRYLVSTRQARKEAEIGPNEYIQMYRERNLSDAPKLFHAKQTAKDELTGSECKSHHSGSSFEQDDTNDQLHYLVWRDHRGETTIYKMPTTSSFDVDDVFASQDTSYARFFHEHTCYDLIPNSSKIVVFDTRLTVKKAFYGLVNNGVKAGILWETSVQNFTGLLTVTDFIEILYKYSNSDEANFENIENDSIARWKSLLRSKPLIHCSPEDKLFSALLLLSTNKVHRLLVVDAKLGNPVNVLTHKRILNLLHLHMHNLPEPSFMSETISSLGIGTFSNLATITFDTTLIETLKLFLEHRISAVPVVDENHKLLSIFAKFDFSRLAYDKLYSDLDRPVREILPKKSEDSVHMFTCRPDDTLKSAVKKIVMASVHRLIIVDETNKAVGVLSLSDILKCLVLTPFDKEEKRLEMIKATDFMKSTSRDSSPPDFEIN